MEKKRERRRGLDLVRSDVRVDAVKPSERVVPQRGGGELARIQTRRVMRAADGRVISLTPEKVAVWLVQLEPVNQIVLEGSLDEEGYAPRCFSLLQDLPTSLKETSQLPRLILIQAQAVGQQGPFFRKLVMPLLEEKKIECVLTGLDSEQEKRYRSWYEGKCIKGDDLDEVMRYIKQQLGPGLK